MIEQILPAEVVSVDTRADWVGAALDAAGELALNGAVEQRRREFATARACARQALERLNGAATPIPVGTRGEPLWPASTVGSITHCAGYRGCAVARAEDVVALGIDAEPHAPLSDRVRGAIARPQERVELAQLARVAPAICWDRLLFSAKESVYKAWFPLTHRWLGFEDVTLTFDPQRETFRAELHVSPPLIDGVALTEMHGRFWIHDGLLLTAIVLPRQPCARA